MPRGFDQQNASANFSFPRSAAAPQHGQKPDKKTAKPREPRAHQPRPGH